MKRTLFAIGLITMVMISCKEDDLEPTLSQILIANTWQVAGGIVDGIEVNAQPCLSDDKIFLEATGVSRWNHGANKCGTIPDETTGTWQLLKDDTEMVWEDNGLESRLRIVEFSSTSFSAIQIEPAEDATYIFKSVK